MLPRTRRLASGSLVPSSRSRVGFCPSVGCPILGVSSSGGGLFGRPEILWIRGALYFCRVSQLLPSFHADALAYHACLPWIACWGPSGEPRYHFGTSSFFPEDRL